MKLTGLLNLPALYLSKYIQDNKNDYYIRLRAVTENNDWEKWLLYMLDIIEKTALEDRRRILKTEQLMREMGVEISIRFPKIFSKDLLEEIFKLPYTKRNRLTAAGLGNLKTAGNYLIELEKAGFLKSEQVGKEKLYVNFRLLELLKSG